MSESLSYCQRGCKLNAEMYSEMNDLQFEYGKRFAATAGIKHGDKVLDMGCGTGELTSHLAEKVGKESQVVGVDPDAARIKVAIQKHSGVHENITFKHGDSSTQFPHYNEEYYDIHFSNFVFQWLNAEEKNEFINCAFKTIKPGGKIAIQSHEAEAEIMKQASNLFLCDTDMNADEKVPVYFVNKSVTESLLRKAGFFILSSEYFRRSYTFPTADHFLAFVHASDYYDETRISPIKKKDLFNKIVNKDGTVSIYDPSVYQIVAKK